MSESWVATKRSASSACLRCRYWPTCLGGRRAELLLQIGRLGRPTCHVIQLPGLRLPAQQRSAGPADRLADRADDLRDRRAGLVRARQQARNGILHRLALFRLLALGDIDDGADQAGDAALRTGEGCLVVNRVALRALRQRDGRFIRLRARFGPQALVGAVHALGDFGRVRIELVHRTPDDRGARPLEEGFPRPVDAEVAAVDALEEHRIGQRFDQQLGLPLRLGELGLALAQVFGDFPGDAVRAMRRGQWRALVEQLAGVEHPQLQRRGRVARNDVGRHVADVEGHADDPGEHLAPHLLGRDEGVGAIGGEAHAHASFSRGDERDRTRRDHGSGIACPFYGLAPRRISHQVQAQAPLIAGERRDVLDHDILGTRARRPDGEARVARRMHARVGAHGFLVLVLHGGRHVARIAERTHVACAARGTEILDIALEGEAAGVRLGLEHPLQADQDDVIVAQPRFDGVARVGNHGVEARARRLLDFHRERAPGEERHHGADGENRPCSRLAQPLA